MQATGTRRPSPTEDMKQHGPGPNYARNDGSYFHSLLPADPQLTPDNAQHPLEQTRQVTQQHAHS